MTTPDPTTAPPLTLRAGAYYRTRDGKKVGPLIAGPDKTSRTGVSNDRPTKGTPK